MDMNRELKELTWAQYGYGYGRNEVLKPNRYICVPSHVYIACPVMYIMIILMSFNLYC